MFLDRFNKIFQIIFSSYSRIEDLLQGLGSQSQNSTLSSSLMNLVMQFRKVGR